MPFLMVANRNYFQNGIRQFLMWIDSIVYSFVSFLMQVIFDIANMSGSSFQELATQVMSRIYIILAIFMTFKVIVSLLTYLVNPDTMSDKQQGAGKLVLRVLLVFVMLIAQPRVFGLLYEAQLPILRTLPKLVLSADAYKNDTDSSIDVEDQGIGISWAVFRAFYTQNVDCVGNDETALNRIPTFITNEGGTDTRPPANVFSLVNNHINDACEDTSDGSVYQYDFKPIISTLAGGFLCYTLIGIAITVAIRMFKMVILQIIAPIPIISYIDPKASKDGAFNQWLKSVVSTWLDLFINLAIVYLVIFIVTELVLKDSGGVYSYISGLGIRRGLFVTIFLILGLFSFAKQAPKFIMDALGIKSKNNFSKALGMSAAVMGAPVAAGKDFANRVKTEGWASAGKNVGRSLFTGVGSAFMGSQAAYEGDKLSASGEARRKYLDSRLSYISSDTKKKQDMYDRTKAVNDTAFNVKKVAEEEAVKDKDYKKYAKYIENAMAGDETSKSWLMKDALTKGFTTTDAQGNTVFDSAAAANWLENDYKDQKVNELFSKYGTDAANNRLSDAMDEHNKAIDEATNVRVDGTKVTYQHVDSSSDISTFKKNNLGRSSHAASVLSRDTGVRGAKRRKK